MRNLIRGASAFLSLVAVAMAFLYGVQRENLVPHDTQMRGFINFHTVKIGRAEILAGMRRIAAEQQLGIYQLSTPGGTCRTDLLSRGADEATQPIPLSWLRPGKEGSVYSSDHKPDWNISGPYVLRGDVDAIGKFRSWLDDIHAVNRWDAYEPWKLFVATMAYQGVALTLLVALVLLLSVVLAWYARHYTTRSVRVLGGVSAARIHWEDTAALVTLIVPPSLLTALVAVVVLVVIRGWVALSLMGLTLGLLGCGYVLTVLVGIAISAMTWPSTKRYALRRPIPRRFGWIADGMRVVVTVTVLASVPLIAVTLDRASTHTRAADMVALIPKYYTVNFGGIFDEARDYEAHVPSFARLIRAQEDENDVGYTRLVRDIPLPGDQFTSLVIYNHKLFGDICAVVGGSTYVRLSEAELPLSAQQSILSRLGSRGRLSGIQFWTTGAKSEPLALEGSGVFTLAPRPLIVVLPRFTEFFPDEAIVADATRGMVMFRDGARVMRDAAAIGLNLTADDVSQSVAVYASDQRLGLQVAVVSLIILVGAFLALELTAAFVHALLQAPRTFPKYLNGESTLSLTKRSIGLDCLAIVIPAAVSGLVCWLLDISVTLSLIVMTAMLGVVVIVVRNYATKYAMRQRVLRKD